MRSTLFTLMLLPLMVSAQNWCAPGATWTYTETNNWTFDGMARYQYIGDTVIAGVSAQIITTHIEGYYWPLDTMLISDGQPYFTHVEGSRVDLWTGAAFDTLYDFAAVPGDHWFMNAPDGVEPFILTTVQDTGHVMIDGHSLRYLITDDSDTIIERLGSLSYHFVPWSQYILDASDGPLRCYSDSEIDHMSPSWVFGCASITGIHQDANTAFRIFPNPGNDHLTISLPPGPHRIVITDVTGKEVMRTRTKGTAAQLATGQLPAGLYSIRIDDAMSVTRWVKE